MEKTRVLARTLGSKLDKEELLSINCGDDPDCASQHPDYPTPTYLNGQFYACDSLS